MLIYRGELVTGRAAMLRLMLRDLTCETVFLGPVSVNDGTVARLINEPNGGLRMEYWKRGTGWVEAPGSMALAHFMPGKMKPVSADLAARLDIPAAELDDVTPFEIELAKHEMSRRPRAKIVGALKNRAWTLACRWMTPGNG